MKNVGSADRAARIAAGVGLLMLGATKRGAWRLAIPAGLRVLYTAYTQYCPINRALGIDTYEEKHERVIESTGKPHVQEASEESFPASDAPAWTAGTT